MINMRRTLLVFSIFLFQIASVSSISAEELTKISVLGGMGELSEKILKIRNQPFEEKEGILIIDVSDKKRSYQNLLECAKDLQIKLSVIRENLEKAHILYDIESKDSYRRKVTRIDEHGNLFIDRIDGWRYVYDPYNPGAMKSGKYEGYVAYPNIDIYKEIQDFMEAISELRTIGQVLKLIDPSLVIKMPDVLPTDIFNFTRLYPPRLIDQDSTP